MDIQATWKRWGFSTLAAALLVVATNWPTPGEGAGVLLPILSVLGLAALARAVQYTASHTQAFLVGQWFATLWLSGTFWWLFVAMHTYGGVPALLAAFAVFALAAALGIYYALACVLIRSLGQRSGWGVLVFASAWTMAELARGTWLTGFGWGALGYFHVDGPLSGYLPWVGSYGVGFMAAALAALLAVRKGYLRSVQPYVIAAIVFAIPLSVPVEWNEWTSPAGVLKVELLQGNIPQDEKFAAGTGVPMALSWYAEQLQQSRADLVVAPEVAIPLLPQELPAGYMEALQQRFSNGKQAALVGVALGSYAEGYTNSVIGLSPDHKDIYRYDKHHLVPFGEFTPPWFKWFMAMMNNPLGDFNRGDLGQAPMAWRGQQIAANICYEDLFGEELAVRFLNPAHQPTIFANVSNLGWFGNTSAMEQHLAISRVRALELQRPFVRATNTGATAIIDHRGRVVSSLARVQRGVLHGEVEGRTGVTPYAWWVGRWGLMPWWILGVAIVFLAWRKSAPQKLQASTTPA